MKILIITAWLYVPCLVFAQSKPVKILFDVTSSDTATHQAVLRHVQGMSKAYPHAELEVVVYGGAWPMVVTPAPGGSIIEKLALQENVSFKICGITMQRHNVQSSSLVQGVEVVPDAIIEIVTKQGQGWGYIKESHN